MPSLHFLLLEDDPVDVELISTTLRNDYPDCQITVTSTREAFQTSLKQEPIDLILTDYSIPGFDGLTAIQMAQSVDKHIPCILISGILGEELAIESLKGGATDYVLKQRLERLVPVLQRALREKQERLELARTAAALKASEELFRTSVENMNDCLALLSAVYSSAGKIQDFTITFLNDAACKSLSLDKDLQLGKPLYAVLPGLKNNISSRDLHSAFCWVVETNTLFHEEILLQWQHEPEQFASIDLRAARLNDGLVVTWRDVTERKQAEKQRTELLSIARAAQKQAEQANHSKDDFLAMLSYELRTPLSSITGWLQLATANKLPPKMLNEALKTIQHHASLLEQLIDDMLDVSQVIQGQFRISLQSLTFSRLNGLITSAIEVIMPAALAKHLQVTFNPSPMSGQIAGDPDRLRQVLWTLLSNAVKFTPASGNITVTLDQQDSAAIIKVQDTGQGLAPEQLSAVFARFQQVASESAHRTGLGLGMSIARYIVESHGGQIEASSPGVGKGSTFTVRLPLQTSAEATVVEPTSYTVTAETGRSSQTEQEISLQDVRVLVVEDIDDACELYTLMLEEYGADVRSTASAAEGFETFCNFLPHVLISDISMPEEDGYSLMRRIRALPLESGGGVPAVALTAYTRPRDRTRALLSGFQLYIPKPVDLDELVTVVDLLRRRNTYLSPLT